jgi:hypothetical protein
VVHVDHAVAEAPLVEKLEVHPDVSGQPRLAAAHDDREHQQVDLVHQPGPERVLRQAGPLTLMSRSATSFMRRTASGSNSRSSRVRGVDTASSVREYTTLSRPRHTSA